jgi:antitoxin (DNA-binding transcriptional repressor) of toxin-antitoxin stability system
MTFSPNLGRWLQEDPIRIEAGDPNFYRYVRNNPSSYLDPLGLKCEKEYVFPAGLLDALEVAWRQSDSGTAQAVEQGGSIILDKNGKTVIRPIPQRKPGKKPGENMVIPGGEFPKAKEGESMVGTYHTHPLLPGEADMDVTFSGPVRAGLPATDLHSLLGSIATPVTLPQFEGTEMIVRSPNCIFVLALDDLEKCKKNAQLTLKRFSEAWKANEKKPRAERQEVALLEAIKDSGLCYYKVCKKDGKFPDRAPLVAPK